MLDMSNWTPFQAFIAGFVTYFLMDCVQCYFRGFLQGVQNERKQKKEQSD